LGLKREKAVVDSNPGTCSHLDCVCRPGCQAQPDSGSPSWAWRPSLRTNGEHKTKASNFEMRRRSAPFRYIQHSGQAQEKAPAFAGAVSI
jgi:hypothetical protein